MAHNCTWMYIYISQKNCLLQIVVHCFSFILCVSFFFFLNLPVHVFHRQTGEFIFLNILNR
jgi:hypothetical protein